MQRKDSLPLESTRSAGQPENEETTQDRQGDEKQQKFHSCAESEPFALKV